MGNLIYLLQHFSVGRTVFASRLDTRESSVTMPTVVVMDVSLSMTRPVSIEGSEEYQRKHLAAHGLTMLFEHMATNYKLEFTALVVFSSLWELMVPFTRDYNTLQVHKGVQLLYV